MPKIKDSEWTKELYYHDTPLKDRDQIYLKCYKNGEAGYVGQYQELHPSETIVTIMNGISTSRKTEDKTVRYAVWVPEAKKDSDAFQFIVHRDGDNGEKVWLEADIVGGHQAVPRAMICIDQDNWMYFENGSNKRYMEFSGAGHMRISGKDHSVHASDYSEASYLNVYAAGESCIFVPEKVKT